MITARNQSGDAPEGVIEVELGSLRTGDKFRLHGGAGRFEEGEVLRVSECSVRVVVQGDNAPVEFQALNEETGEFETKRIARSGRREENWAPSTPVEVMVSRSQEGL